MWSDPPLFPFKAPWCLSPGHLQRRHRRGQAAQAGEALADGSQILCLGSQFPHTFRPCYRLERSCWWHAKRWNLWYCSLKIFPSQISSTSKRHIPKFLGQVSKSCQSTPSWKASAGREVKRVARETRDAMVLLRHTAKHGEQQVPWFGGSVRDDLLVDCQIFFWNEMDPFFAIWKLDSSYKTTELQTERSLRHSLVQSDQIVVYTIWKSFEKK